MERHFELDKTDLKILTELVADAKTPYTEVAERIPVSGGTVHVRMKKLERMGIVKGATLTLDLARLGYDITAFIGIYLERSMLYDQVAEALSEIPEILNLHYTTGEYSIFARIACRDTQHLREVLHQKIQRIEGITRTETFISLEERFNRALDLKTLPGQAAPKR